MTDHLAVMPTGDCRRLGHPVVELPIATGDKVRACRLCTLARRTAIDAGQSPEFADAFVLALRSEAQPYPGDAEPLEG
ncbi:hypothetical protein BH20ACT8_BH20ACT8_09700 [soil metagenome]